MEISVKKCGIIVNPPAFVIVYVTQEKLRRKVFPLRNFTSLSNVDLTACELKGRKVVEKIPLVKIKKMLRLVQELMNGANMLDSVGRINKLFELKLNEDLNRLPMEELEQQKQLMESIFLKNQIKQNDENFIYDKRMNFNGEKTESDWDIETEDDFWT